MSKRVNRDDIDKLHDYGIYIPIRTIYMGSEEYDLEKGESGTDGLMAERIIKNLMVLEGMNKEPITIVMNNVGGDVQHGIAIFDAIQACKSHITIRVFGNACSMGSVILQSADERIMAPNAVQMIHYGSSSIEDHNKTVLKHVEEIKRGDVWMEKMYLNKIQEKQPLFRLPRLKNMLSHDTYLTAKESVELGLADKVLNEEDSNE